jgi:hypothetical protein
MTHTKERCERGRLFNSKKEYAKYCKMMQNMEGSSLSHVCPQHLLSIVIGVGGKKAASPDSVWGLGYNYCIERGKPEYNFMRSWKTI